jgi:hypothetical protein
MLFFVLPIIIPLVTAFPPTGEGTCYNIDGSIDRFSSACYFLSSVGASMCCQGNEEYLHDGLCAGAPNGPVGPDDDNKAIWRRSCSDYTWQDPACLAIAPCKCQTCQSRPLGQLESRDADMTPLTRRGCIGSAA